MPTLNHTAFVNSCRDERDFSHHTLRAYVQPAFCRRVDAAQLHPETILTKGLGHTALRAKGAQESRRRCGQKTRRHSAFDLARRNGVRSRDGSHCLRVKTERLPEAMKASTASSGTVADQASKNRQRADGCCWAFHRASLGHPRAGFYRSALNSRTLPRIPINLPGDNQL